MLKRKAVVEYVSIVGLAVVAALGVVTFKGNGKGASCSARKPCSVTLWGQPVHNGSPRTFEAVQQLPKGFKTVKGHD